MDMLGVSLVGLGFSMRRVASDFTLRRAASDGRIISGKQRPTKSLTARQTRPDEFKKVVADEFRFDAASQESVKADKEGNLPEPKASLFRFPLWPALSGEKACALASAHHDAGGQHAARIPRKILCGNDEGGVSQETLPSSKLPLLRDRSVQHRSCWPRSPLPVNYFPAPAQPASPQPAPLSPGGNSARSPERTTP